MVQHVFIKADAGKIIVDPTHIFIYRDDQYISWNFDASAVEQLGLQWDNSDSGDINPGGPDRAIQITTSGWLGTTPKPTGDRGDVDRRQYNVIGPGPTDEASASFHYDIWVIDQNNVHHHLNDQVEIDPDIGNQPQP